MAKPTPLGHLPPEQRMALALILPEGVSARFSLEPIHTLDENTLFNLVYEHNIYAHTVRKIADGKLVVSETFALRLQQKLAASAQYGLLFTATLLSIVNAANAQQVRLLPFKGPSLSAWLYGDPAFRLSADLDLLVHSDDLLAANQLLLNLGFTTRDRLDVAHYNYKYYHPSKQIGLELHVALLNLWSYDFAFPTEQLFNRATTQTLAGHSLQTLHPADYFTYLCLHALTHTSSLELKWLADLFYFIANETDPSAFLEEIIVTPHLQPMRRGLMMMVNLLDTIGDLGVTAYLEKTSTRRERSFGKKLARRVFDRPRPIIQLLTGKYYTALAHKHPLQHLVWFGVSSVFRDHQTFDANLPVLLRPMHRVQRLMSQIVRRSW